MRARSEAGPPPGRPLEQLTVLELQALRRPARPRADPPWRRPALHKPTCTVHESSDVCPLFRSCANLDGDSAPKPSGFAAAGGDPP
ncbi:MAG: hypothetical protein KatS3mg102_0704 [Planctomycetota bacterium]|nr:MAG: hypothetical protein KatS3mg102_0704 [Planctomycetota bacterium]